MQIICSIFLKWILNDSLRAGKWCVPINIYIINGYISNSNKWMNERRKTAICYLYVDKGKMGSSLLVWHIEHFIWIKKFWLKENFYHSTLFLPLLPYYFGREGGASYWMFLWIHWRIKDLFICSSQTVV